MASKEHPGEFERPLKSQLCNTQSHPPFFLDQAHTGLFKAIFKRRIEMFMGENGLSHQQQIPGPTLNLLRSQAYRIAAEQSRRSQAITFIDPRQHLLSSPSKPAFPPTAFFQDQASLHSQNMTFRITNQEEGIAAQHRAEQDRNLEMPKSLDQQGQATSTQPAVSMSSALGATLEPSTEPVTSLSSSVSQVTTPGCQDPFKVEEPNSLGAKSHPHCTDPTTPPAHLREACPLENQDDGSPQADHHSTFESHAQSPTNAAFQIGETTPQPHGKLVPPHEVILGRVRAKIARLNDMDESTLELNPEFNNFRFSIHQDIANVLMLQTGLKGISMAIEKDDGAALRHNVRYTAVRLGHTLPKIQILVRSITRHIRDLEFRWTATWKALNTFYDCFSSLKAVLAKVDKLTTDKDVKLVEELGWTRAQVLEAIKPESDDELMA